MNHDDAMMLAASNILAALATADRKVNDETLLTSVRLAENLRAIAYLRRVERERQGPPPPRPPVESAK